MTFTFSVFVTQRSYEYLDNSQGQQTDWLIYCLTNNQQNSRKLPGHTPHAPSCALGDSSLSRAKCPGVLCLPFLGAASSGPLKLLFRAVGKRVPPLASALSHLATATYTFWSSKVSCSLRDPPPIPPSSPPTDQLGFHYVVQNNLDLRSSCPSLPSVCHLIQPFHFSKRFLWWFE